MIASHTVRRRLAMTAVAVSAVILGAAAYWTLGPREPVARTSAFSAQDIGPDISAWLAAQEADIPNLRPDAAKEIVWAYPASRARTPLAIVYIHGFSASKAELRPVPDMIARKLGANLFYTRLAGHGRNEAAMAEASVGDWLDDLSEAVAIGRRIGEKVVIIGTSTGGALTAYGASLPGMLDGVAGVVLVSPNFAVRDWRSFLLTMPYARQIVPFLHGDTYGEAPRSQPADEAADTYGWTRGFPTVALLPMAALAQAAAAVDFASIHTPALFILSPADKVVDASVTLEAANQWGGPHQVLQIDDSTDPSQHLIAGDLRSPQTSQRVADAIADWIASLP